MTDTPLLVVGTQRSGTTLLNRILNGHPRIALLFQQSNFLRLDFAGLHDLDVPAAVAQARQADSVYSRRFTDEVERRVVERLRGDADAGSVYRTVIRVLTGEGNAAYRGEKYAGGCIDALKFLDVAPTGRIVHIIRDPRDVCASEKRRQEAENAPAIGRPYLLMLHDWCVGLFVGDYLARVVPQRYHRLRYEDLVGSPEETVRGICAFLGLPFAPSMLEAEAFVDDDGRPWEANSHFLSGVTALRDFRGRWKDHLPEDEAMFVELFCGAGMAALGYPREVSTPWRRLRARRTLAEMTEQTAAQARKYRNHPAYRSYSPVSTSDPIDLAEASAVYRRDQPGA